MEKEGGGGKGAERSLVRRGFLDEVHVAHQHAAAAEAREARRVEGLLAALARGQRLLVDVVGGADDLAAREAANGDDHGITGTTSGASCGRRGRGASWLP